MTGLSGELWLGWTRIWAGRLNRVIVAAAIALVLLVWLTAPVASGREHRELALLESVNEIVDLVLSVIAVVGAYRLVAPDLNDGFESLGGQGRSSPLPFAAGRATAGLAAVAATAAAIAAVVLALDSGGTHRAEELVRLTTLLLNAIPFMVLTLLLITAFGRLAGLVGACFLQAYGTEAAYDRAALSDGFIAPGWLLSLEQRFAWLGPRPLVDQLHGLALRDHSVALNQFPVRQGSGVWGMDLVRVSTGTDLAVFVAYLVGLLLLLYVTCQLRGRQARRRTPVPFWLESSRGGLDEGPITE